MSAIADTRECSEAGCTNGVPLRRGLCNTHYNKACYQGRLEDYPLADKMFQNCRGTWFHWRCQTCGRLSFATFATEDEARRWRLIHEAGCTPKEAA